MRICIVTREYPPVTPYSGGIGSTFAALAPELARLGHELHVVTLTAGSGGPLERDGVQLHLLRRPTPQRLFFLEDPPWAAVTARAVRRHGPFDVVFAAEYGGDASAYTLRRPAGPLVVQLTSSIEQILAVSQGLRPSFRWRLKWGVQARMERFQTERADGILASTQAILDWARRLWRLDDIPSVVVPNVVEVERVRAQARGEPPSGFPNGDAPTVAFAGRLEPRKAPDVLVRAMHTVWREIPEARLVMLGADIGGAGAMSARLRELAGEFGDRLYLLGAHPPERLFPALAAADVVALPSLWENFAAAALESMALGRPVVATTAGGFPEFIDSGADGVLVPPGDELALGRALAGLISDKAERTRLGSAAARRAERYAVPAVAPEYLAFFEQIAGRT